MRLYRKRNMTAASCTLSSAWCVCHRCYVAALALVSSTCPAGDPPCSEHCLWHPWHEMILHQHLCLFHPNDKTLYKILRHTIQWNVLKWSAMSTWSWCPTFQRLCLHHQGLMWRMLCCTLYLQWKLSSVPAQIAWRIMDRVDCQWHPAPVQAASVIWIHVACHWSLLMMINKFSRVLFRLSLGTMNSS
jgi:hypothetical protein